jgi:hypothetical protein
MARTMPRESKWLRASTAGAALSPVPRTTAEMRGRLRNVEAGRTVGADRDARVLRGYVLAQAGVFHSQGRGEFDLQSLQAIVRLGNAAPGGLKSRYTHPEISADGLGKHLGRAKDLSLSAVVNASGQTVSCVRGDLHFAKSASRTPSGNLSGYLLDLAAEDSDALSSSLALQVEKEFRLDAYGSPLVDDQGEELPPIWRPTRIHASDIVAEGDAVDGILGGGGIGAGIDVDNLPLAALWKADTLLDSVFAGQPADVVEVRLRAWTERYLARLRGESSREGASSDLDRRRRRLDLHERAAAQGGDTQNLWRRLKLHAHEARC